MFSVTNNSMNGAPSKPTHRCPFAPIANENNRANENNPGNFIAPTDDIPTLGKAPSQQPNLKTTSTTGYLLEGVATLSVILAANTIHETVIENTPTNLKHYAHMCFVSSPILFFIAKQLHRQLTHQSQQNTTENT